MQIGQDSSSDQGTINLVHRIRGTTVSDKKKDTTAQPCNGSAYLVENRSSLFLAMLSFTMPKHEDPPTLDSSMKKSNFNGGVSGKELTRKPQLNRIAVLILPDSRR